jgi:hypothetical protein
MALHDTTVGSTPGGEFPSAGDRPESGQDKAPREALSLAFDALAEFATSVNIRVTSRKVTGTNLRNWVVEATGDPRLGRPGFRLWFWHYEIVPDSGS